MINLVEVVLPEVLFRMEDMIDGKEEGRSSTFKEAKIVIEAWRQHYNTVRRTHRWDIDRQHPRPSSASTKGDGKMRSLNDILFGHSVGGPSIV